jgi:hypothetical protein
VIIPRDPLERQLLVEELVRHCTVSRVDRFNFYQVARNYLLFGTMDAQGCPYNKVKATVETLTSFIYSPDDVRFSLHLQETAPPLDIAKAPTLGRFITDSWRKSNAHFIFDKAATWSLAFGCFLMKSFWKHGRVYTYTVEPHQFGVYREDIMDLNTQEAFTHHYVITRTELDSSLQGNPRRQAIMSRVGQQMADQLPPLATGMQRLIVGSPVGGVPGSSAIPGTGNMVGPGGIGGRGGPVYDYVPRIDAELIDMCDLYVWNDETEDYQVFTRAAPDVVIYDRPSSWLGHVRGVAPFTVVRTSNFMYDWFWGDSFVADLTWLQDWRTERILDVRQLLRKQFDPPMSIVGGTGIQEEKLLALRVAGGQVSFPVPTAKVQTHEPTMPQDVFMELQQIDAMFDDQAGIGHVLQGKGEAGVRSKGQVDIMARLSSARPKKRAMVLEACAEDAANQMLLLHQEHSEHRFVTQMDGQPVAFTAEQFTREYEVRIDSHSASPIFVEDRKHDAVTLREAHAIDRHSMLEMFNPPNVQELQERLKVIEAAEEQARKEQLQLQLSQGTPPKRQRAEAHAT